MPEYADSFTWLAAASAVVWLGLGGYLAFLAARQKNLARRLKQLELWRSESED